MCLGKSRNPLKQIYAAVHVSSGNIPIFEDIKSFEQKIIRVKVLEKNVDV
jgi:hypothetical protein